jgi:hypothetical protein
VLLLITHAHTTCKKFRTKHLGRLVQPRHFSSIHKTAEQGFTWAADNDAFSGFGEAEEERFLYMLKKLNGLPGCRFITTPDVVGDPVATIENFGVWHERIKAHNLPVGFVGQDGVENHEIPWHLFDAFFIGGGTDWKLSSAARELVQEAKVRKKWVHMGRVNSFKRMKIASQWGCDSVDGNGFTKFLNQRLQIGLDDVEALSRRYGGGRMFLTELEQAKVAKTARKLGLEGDPQDLVEQAIAAEVKGEATEDAYLITKAAGVFMGNHIWVKEKKPLVEDQARAIIKQAQADGVYKGSEPEDGQYAIAEAARLEEMARIAWANNQRGGEVERILRLAAEWTEQLPPQQPPNRGADEEFAPVATDDNDIGGPGSDDSGLEADIYGNSDGFLEDEPWPGYDKAKIGEIKERILRRGHSNAPVITIEADLAYLSLYEKAHKGRVRVEEYVQQARKVLYEKTEEQQEESQGAQAPEGREDSPTTSPEEAPGGTGGSEGSEEDRRQDSPQQDGESYAEAQSDREADEQSEEDAVRGIIAAQEAREDEDRAEYEELIADVEDEIRRQRLHTPGELPEGEAPELPFDLTTLSDRELQALYSAFNAYAYRVTYLLMVEDAKMRRCRDAADEIYKYLLSTWPKYDEQNKEKRVATIEAEIEQDPNVRKWRRRQRLHDVYANAYRQERDSYIKVVDTLSRLETMRNNEFERSGQRRR